MPAVTMPPSFALVMGGYFLLILSVGLLASKNSKTLVDYFLAGQKLGAWPIAISFVAAWFGAASTMGSMNAFHDLGLSAAWEIALPSCASLWVITYFFSKRVAAQNCLSQPEAIETHYGRLGRLLLSLVILCSVTAFIGSQIVAAGKLFGAVLSLDLFTATAIVTSTVVLYTMVGGYFSVVMTDICQFLLFTGAMLTLFLFVGNHYALHPEALQTLLASHPPSFWKLSNQWGYHLVLFITFVLAWSIAPEMWQRMTAAAEEKKAFLAAQRASVGLIALFLLVGTVGILSPGLVGPSKLVLVDLALQLPHESLSALVILGVAAAITSTMDSSLNVGSLTFTRDLYQGFLRPQASSTELVWVGRLATILIALPAMAIALYHQDIIRVLWISGDIYASTMFFPVVGILYTRTPSRWSGLLAMALGGITVLTSAAVQYHWIALPFPWPSWPYSTLLGITMSGLGFALGYWIEKGLPTYPKGSKTCTVPSQPLISANPRS